MKKVLQEVQPDVVLVHGDTTTAMATAMAGFYAGIPVGHVEAGLRTHDLHSPFPEEFNRRVVGRVARWHFSDRKSRENLFDEKVSPETIYVTGTLAGDSLFWVLKRLDGDPQRNIKIESFLNRQLSFPWQAQQFTVLITGHRRENFGQGFLQICGSCAHWPLFPRSSFRLSCPPESSSPAARF